MSDISPSFYTNFKAIDRIYAEKLLKLEATPQAIIEFDKFKNYLSDYSYWFLLSTLWVSYTGYSNLQLWKDLFNSNRILKNKSIMKPSELEAFKNLPYFITAYRAHRPNEQDYIAYTLNVNIAKRLNLTRKGEIKKYKIKKKNITALFLRRGEEEIILLNKDKAEEVKLAD